MVKTPIDRTTLAEKALAAVRAEPGCESVKIVSITTVTVVNDGSTDWRLQVTDPGEADINEAHHAANRVKDALAVQFDLSDA